jgi:thioredoxin reductase
LDAKARWKNKITDPSLGLSPFTHDRLREEKKNGRITLIGNSKIKEVKKNNDGSYEIILTKKGKSFTSQTQPILGTGFSSSLSLVEDLFDWHEQDSYALINEQDESTKTPGLFLAGPQVRHENLIFCFIYKYRLRFGVVANAIGKALGLDTSVLDDYREKGLYLDDLSCCGDECSC